MDGVRVAVAIESGGSDEDREGLEGPMMGNVYKVVKDLFVRGWG